MVFINSHRQMVEYEGLHLFVSIVANMATVLTYAHANLV